MVSQLKEPYWAEPTPGAIMYANLVDEVFLDGMESVINDSELTSLIVLIMKISGVNLLTIKPTLT